MGNYYSNRNRNDQKPRALLRDFSGFKNIGKRTKKYPVVKGMVGVKRSRDEYEAPEDKQVLVGRGEEAGSFSKA